MSTTAWPGPLSSGLVTWSARTTSTAKATRVGGTSRSLKVPLMESLPPMAGAPRASSACRAPSRAAKGLPHRAGSSLGLPKYSCRVKRSLRGSPPTAARRAAACTWAHTAPWKGLQRLRAGK